ncbi:MAG: hypothetical protein KHY22_04015 [Sutterella wadsworthensis]|jgi:hypothetical protein|nr:hypothetical protein [Sutterella wadsworthensis]MDU5054390.1 hypothetical protein [Sutterella wadsworthensis]DAV25634.1 MAG TPA: Protein of unknown function (DUF2634) [Caudoviricetes sp.]
MTHTAFTLALNDSWDIDLDEGGNLKLYRDKKAVLQNVANECRLFKHDAYFRYEEGIDWGADQLGKKAREILVVSRLREAAELVDDVESVDSVELDEFNPDTRTLKGTITVTTKWGKDEKVRV